jgi:streptomycin 6-kinase
MTAAAQPSSSPSGIVVPERLHRTVTAWEGEAGRAWLAALPELAADFVRRWELTVERVLEPGGQISLVLLVRDADGEPAALKVGMVTVETAQEAEALTRWAGRGAVRLLRAEPEQGALLLERLHADVSLRSLPEARATLEATETIRRLWLPLEPGHPFRTLPDLVTDQLERLRQRAEQPYAAEARAITEEAARTAAALLADPPPASLLHGDFHQGNVLAGERAPWLAIDPKPLAGDPAYDLAWLVRDRLATLAGSPGPAAAARRRIRTLADSLELDADRLRGWTLFRAAEAGLWSLSVGDRDTGELLLEFASWL